MISEKPSAKLFLTKAGEYITAGLSEKWTGIEEIAF